MPTRCMGCESELPAPFLDLGSTPLANSYVKPEQAGLAEKRYPLAVAYCPGCHAVQLTETVPPADIFSEYLYFSSYSTSYLEHARRMADSLTTRFSLGPESFVVEIASNDGYLLQFFQGAGVPVLGVEPAGNIASVAEAKGIPTWNRFFDAECASLLRRERRPADIIIGNNVLAHVPSNTAFLTAVRDALSPRGTAVFEFPHLLELIRHCEFDTIYHEHYFYFSLSAIQNLAARAGLELYDVEPQPVHGGALRVFLQKGRVYPISSSVHRLLAEEREAGLTDPAFYGEFGRRVRGLKDCLVDLLFQWKESGRRIAAYGAPAKGNTLLNYCGIGRDLIDFTVDRSPYKQGLLLPGSHIPIREPEALAREMPDYTLILPWNLTQEILSQQHTYRQNGGRFVVPVPHPRVLADVL